MPLTITALPPRAGVYVYEQTAGPTPPEIELYRRTYIIGSATAGPIGIPTPIGSYDDFINTFVASSALNLNNIRAYLANTKLGLFFVRVGAYPVTTVTVTDTTAGVKSFTINGVTISHMAADGATFTTIVTALVTALNNNVLLNTAVEAEYQQDAAGLPIFPNGQFFIRSLTVSPFTLAAVTGTTFAVVTAPATPQYWDYLREITVFADTQQYQPLGFLIAPEAFYTLANQWQRTQIANTLEATARSLNYYAALDPGAPNVITTAVQAVAESLNYLAIRGHSAYYYPYLFDSDGDDVSPSVMLAAFALQRYEVEGIHQPPAGPKYPFRGIGGVRETLSAASLDLMATNRINPMIFLRGRGFIPYDTYTRATDTNFRMISARIILSCLERSIESTVKASGVLFDAVTVRSGGRGIFFLKLQNIIHGVVSRFYEGDALYGVNPGDAFVVLCSAAGQNSVDLEAGIVLAEVYVVPAGTARQIRINVFRVQIGQMAAALATA